MITASDVVLNDLFGLSVAVSNGIVAAGAHFRNNEGGVHAGVVYIYVRREDGSWTEQAKLVGSDEGRGDEFGYSVAIHGSTLIAGAARDGDRGIESGSVYVFKYEDGDWTQQAKLTASDGSANDWFGTSVSIHGNWLVIGSIYDDDLGDRSGSAYLFEQMAHGGWTQQAKLLAGNGEAGDQFGRSVNVFGDTVGIGSPYCRGRSGAVYLFKIVSGAWTEQAMLVASDADHLGRSISLADRHLVIGSQYRDAGYASCFALDGATWSEQVRFAENGIFTGDRFGWDVAIDQGTVVIGSYGYSSEMGAVYIYEPRR